MKKLLGTTALIIALIANSWAQATTGGDAGLIRVRQEVESLGVDTDVNVTLKYGTKVNGRIIRISGDTFDLRDLAGAVTNYKFADVIKVKKSGLHGAKAALAIGIAAAIVTVIVIDISRKRQSNICPLGCRTF